MRIKTYYSAEEVTNNLYTFGTEFMTEDKQEYIGLYHAYITGEVYTQPEWNPKHSKKLILYKSQNSELDTYKRIKSINVNYINPYEITPELTTQDISVGIKKRFFFKNITTGQIIEVDKSQHDLYDNQIIDPLVYIKMSIDWKIAGSLTDINVNGVLTRGVITYNSAILKKAEHVMSGITTHLSNLTEYYIGNTDVKQPVDINLK